MAATVKLPKFGLTMEEATISRWEVAVGEAVAQGQTIATIESEKVEIELPAPVAGIVAEHLVPVGETVPVGTAVAILVSSADELASYSPRGG
ncbi:MAG: lipoyl domain-containing protein [Gaiella sp.]|nr:lipoyl domain-containing protein [Gaiella sp.]